MRGELNEVDQVARISISMILIATGLTYDSWLVPAGIAILLTGIVGWCPLYFLADISPDKEATQK